MTQFKIFCGINFSSWLNLWFLRGVNFNDFEKNGKSFFMQRILALRYVEFDYAG